MATQVTKTVNGIKGTTEMPATYPLSIPDSVSCVDLIYSSCSRAKSLRVDTIRDWISRQEPGKTKEEIAATFEVDYFGNVRVECLHCGSIEYLDPEDYHPGIPYFCTSRCQETYEYESDPINFSNPEYEG